MLNELVLKGKHNINVIKNLAKVFYGDQLREGKTYSINETTGLNYFGEYLERHIQTNLSIYDIMAAVSYRNDMKMDGYQIYDGQFELFVERVEAERKNNGSFKLDILYLMFLQKLNETKLFNEVITEFLSNLKLDREFLIFTAMIQNGYLKITDKIREKVIVLLNEEVFEIEFSDICIKAKTEYYSLQFKTEMYALKHIFKTYNLKKSEFKNNLMKFEAYKALRKFGTKDTSYDNCNHVLNLDKQSFYFLALKVANETYVEGSSMVRANLALIDMLSENINPNSDLYVILPGLRLRVAGGYDTNQFVFPDVDFSDIEKPYFKNAIKMYEQGRNGISFNQISNLIKREDFIEFISGNGNEDIDYEKKRVIIDVIKCSEDKEILEKYYNMIKNQSDLTVSELAVLCNKGFVPLDKIFDAIFYEDNGKLFARDVMGTMINTCINMRLFNVLYLILEKVVSENVTIRGCYWRSSIFSSAVRELEYYISVSNIENDEKKNIFRVLNDFVYMYLSGDYYRFILNNINDELFKEVLNISEEDIKKIGNYLLERQYVVNSTIRSEIKKLIYDEQDVVFDNCKQSIDKFISETISDGYYSSNKEIAVQLAALEDKSRVVDYYKNKIAKLNSDFDGNAVFMDSIRVMLKLNLISEEEAVDIIKERVLKMAV